MTRTASLLAVLALCLLGGCGTDLAQEAKTATVTYTAVTKNVAVVLKSDVLPAKVEACLKTADTVAFNYEDSLNQTAQDWVAAGSADKTTYEKAFVNIQALFNAAMLNVSGLLTGKGVC